MDKIPGQPQRCAAGRWQVNPNPAKEMAARIFFSDKTKTDDMTGAGKFEIVTRLTRSIILLLLACGLGLSGCAYQGTVVAKEFRALPFLHSLGLKGIYRFELRDREGHVHRQMVTASVFANHEVGDYFNDLQAPGAPAPNPESLMIPMLPPPLQEYGTPYWPIKIQRMDPVTEERSTLDEAGQGEVSPSAPVKEETFAGAENSAFASFRYSPEPRM